MTVMNSRGLAAAEAFRRGDLGRASGASTGRGAAGLSSSTLQARQEARERERNSSYGSGGALLRGGEHPAGSGDRDHERDALRAPRQPDLLRHRTDPTDYASDPKYGGGRHLFQGLPSVPSAASQSRDGADDRAAGPAVDTLSTRRRRGAGTPPAYPPPPAHPSLLPVPPPLIPNYSSYIGNAGGVGGGSATHTSAGSRSLPPGRNRPTTPSGQVGGMHARRVNDDPGAATRIGAGPVGALFEGGRGDSFRGSPPEAVSRSRSVAAPGAANAGAGGSSSSTCDKCDGKHPSDQCPHFKSVREKHKDAWVNYGQQGNPRPMGGTGGNFILKSARVVRQPGDGSCLFHSLAHGLSPPSSASGLRREIAGFVQSNPSLEIAGDTLEEWVRWDSNSSVSDYARRMSMSGWGGGIEMAACSLLKGVNVHVYENLYRSSRSGGSSDFKRISCFDSPNATRTIHVLYQGGVHYDALVPA